MANKINAVRARRKLRDSPRFRALLASVEVTVPPPRVGSTDRRGPRFSFCLAIAVVPSNDAPTGRDHHNRPNVVYASCSSPSGDARLFAATGDASITNSNRRDHGNEGGLALFGDCIRSSVCKRERSAATRAAWGSARKMNDGVGLVLHPRGCGNG